MAEFVQLTDEFWVNLDHVAYIRDFPQGARLEIVVGLAVTGGGEHCGGFSSDEVRLDAHERKALLAYLKERTQARHKEPVLTYPPDAQDAV